MWETSTLRTLADEDLYISETTELLALNYYPGILRRERVPEFA